jgi:hypothetical protein
MEIVNVPPIFQPNYISDYPSYSSGKNMEEIVYENLKKNRENIKTNMVYLPVFWTSYYLKTNYFDGIDLLCKWMETLDKNKKYFTIVQCDYGILIKNVKINIIAFSSGGGGINIDKNSCIIDTSYYGLNRSLFSGIKGNYDIPLICLPQFSTLNINRDIYCSFMGRFDTHKCRIDMKNALYTDKNFLFYNSVDYEIYKNIWHDKIILPYSDEIDWNEFSIIIHSNDIGNLPNILKSVDIPKMQNKIETVKQLFTFDKITEYITKIIETK